MKSINSTGNDSSSAQSFTSTPSDMVPIPQDTNIELVFDIDRYCQFGPFQRCNIEKKQLMQIRLPDCLYLMIILFHNFQFDSKGKKLVMEIVRHKGKGKENTEKVSTVIDVSKMNANSCLKIAQVCRCSSQVKGNEAGYSCCTVG